MTGWYEKDRKPIDECAFSYMGQRGAQGQSLRASWQWQHQCQTLEEEKTCMMVKSYAVEAWENGISTRTG